MNWKAAKTARKIENALYTTTRLYILLFRIHSKIERMKGARPTETATGANEKMTIFDLLELLSDTATVEVFSLDKAETVYKGFSDEIPEEIVEQEIASIDTVFPESQHLTINID
jgi:hypothetical protein